MLDTGQLTEYQVDYKFWQKAVSAPDTKGKV